MLAIVLFIAMVTMVGCTVPGIGGSDNPTAVPRTVPAEFSDEEPVTSEMVVAWSAAEGLFRTDATHPVLVSRNGASALFVQANRLFFATLGATARVMYEWAGATQAQSWVNENLVLLGFANPDAQPDPFQQYLWLGLDVETLHTDASPPKPWEAFFGPADVLEVKAVSNPPLIFLAVKNGGTYSEYVYGTSQPELATVNLVTAPGTGYDQVAASRPLAQTGTAAFDSVQVYNLPTGPIWTFTDGRGAVVYFEQPFFYAWRYFQHTALGFKLLTDINGESFPMGRFRAFDGTTVLSLANWAFHSYLEDVPRLFTQDGWRLLERDQFYLVDGNHVETIRYGDGLRGVPTVRSLDVPGGIFNGQEGSLLRYSFGDEERFLSLYDLLNAVPGEGETSPSIKSLLLRKLQPSSSSRDRRPMPDEEGLVDVKLPPLDASLLTVDPPYEVAELVAQSLEGDSVPDVRYREVDGTWYVLIDDHLYVCEDDALQSLGTLPITVAYTQAEGVSSFTARDFLRAGDSWYIADTFGNRVIQVDAAFAVKREYPLPAPSTLHLNTDGTLQVASLKGLTTLSLGLKALAERPLPYHDITDPTENRRLESTQWFKDEANGLTWVYADEMLYQYRPSLNELRGFYVGPVRNAHAHGRVIPYRDRVVVLFDNRAHVFARDGSWQKSFDFPRTTPDGIYVTSPPGENSMILDGAAGKLYLVQGYRVLEIDLVDGTHRSLFMQADWLLGRLLYNDGRLYVSAQVENAGYGRKEPEYTEVIVHDLVTGETSRIVTDGIFRSDSINGGSLVLWKRDNDATTEGTVELFDLEQLQPGLSAPPFPISRLSGASSAFLTNLAGEKKVIWQRNLSGLLELLAEARFESASFPERDTGGGIVGRVTLGFKGGNPVVIDLHDDFVWFDDAAYSLEEAKVQQLMALFR